VVAVTVGDEQFVGRLVHPDVGGPVQVGRVVVALALVALADLHDELAVLRELQELIVGDRLEVLDAVGRAVVAAEPDEALVVDVDAVFALRPLVPVPITAPRLDEVARRVEDDYGRRRQLRLFRLQQRARAVQHEHLILRVDRDARGIAELVLRRHLRPCLVDLEGRHAAPRRLRPLGRGVGADQPLASHAGGDDQGNQNPTADTLARHDFLLVRELRRRTGVIMDGANLRFNDPLSDHRRAIDEVISNH
jgi:hypothetical protein